MADAPDSKSGGGNIVWVQVPSPALIKSPVLLDFFCSLCNQLLHCNKKARKLVKELIDDGGEEDDKNNSSHADPK